MDEALYSAVGSNGIYLVTTEGIVKKFSRESTRGIPVPLWKHPLDGSPQSKLVIGPKALYVATSEGTVYALHPDDGHELWNFKPQHKIKTIGTYKDLLYLASEDGHVIIMNAE
jgi:outer membrane protein assembly factor BamB